MKNLKRWNIIYNRIEKKTGNSIVKAAKKTDATKEAKKRLHDGFDNGTESIKVVVKSTAPYTEAGTSWKVGYERTTTKKVSVRVLAETKKEAEKKVRARCKKSTIKITFVDEII